MKLNIYILDGEKMIQDFCIKKLEELEEQESRLRKQLIPYKKFKLFSNPFRRDDSEQFYTVFDMIFKRRELKEYRNRKDSIERQVEFELSKIDDERKHWTEVQKEERKCYLDWGSDGQDIMQFFRNSETVLDTHDRNISRMEEFKGEDAFTGLDSLLLVHKTNFLPIGDTLYTSRSTKRQEPIRFIFRGKEYTTNFFVQNNATHFTLNGPVANHDAGSWQNCKYAVIVSLQDVDKSNLYGVQPEDTVFLGNVNLGKKYYILVPKSEIKWNKNNTNPNPNATIIGYDGIDLDEAIVKTIGLLGKKEKIVTNNGWFEPDYRIHDWNDYVSPILEEHEISTSGGFFTAEYEVEKRLRNYASISIAILNFLKDNNLTPTIEEIEGILARAAHLSKATITFGEGDTNLYNKYCLQMFRENGFNIPEEILLDENVVCQDWEREKKGINKNRFEVIESLLAKYLQQGKCKEEIEYDPKIIKE